MNNFPTPRHLEEKIRFITRFQTHPRVRATYRDFMKRHVAAENAWTQAKGQSIASVKTARMEFLVLEDRN